MTTRTHVDHARLSQEQAELRERMQRMDDAARANWGDPTWHREMAAEITQSIFEGFRHENVLQLMAEVENVGLNDRITIRETRGLRVFWVSLGGYIEESTLVQDVWELPKDQLGFHVSENEDKLTAGFTVAAGDIRNLAIDRMDAGVNQKFLAIMQAAIDNTSPYYVSGAGLSLAALNTAIGEVREETEDDIPAIVGRSTMTGQIWDQLVASGQFIPESSERLIAQGVLGIYRGARVINLKNFRDDNRVSFWPANELYVVGRDASKFGFWGGLTTKEWNEQGGWYWHLLGRRLAGGAVHHPERVRRFVDTSITP